MGAQRVIEIGFGKNIKEAFSNICREKEEEYGHQEGYSGQINSCSGFIKVKPPYRFGTIKFDKWLEDQFENRVQKRDCFGFEITGKIAVDIKKRDGYARTHNKPFFFYGQAPS